MTAGCQIQCKEGFFSPHGLFDCKGDSLLLQAVPNVREHQPRARGWSGTRSAPQPAGSGRGGWRSVLPGHRADPAVPREGSGAGAGQAAGARWDGLRERSPPGSPDQTGRAGAQSCAPFPPLSHGEGAPQIRVSRGPGCAEMLRRRDVPGATDTGWHCPKVWAQRWGHGLRGAPGQLWDRSGGVPVRHWGAG